MSKARDIFGRIGWRGLIEICFHPVLMPLYALAAWPRALWAARLLLNGQWGRFQGFHPINALNSQFYRTQWLNIDRCGLGGVSTTTGLGTFRLNQWFHLSALSLCIYANAGAAATLLGTLSWVFMHSIWFWIVQWHWVVLIIAVMYFSSTAYLMAFIRQNYNIMGWLWVPLGLFGVVTGQLGLAAVAWFAASLGSITAVIAVIPLVVVLAIAETNPYLLLTFVPATVKLALHAIPMFQGRNLQSGLISVAKLIGFTKRDSRYRRKSMRLSTSSLYFLLLYGATNSLVWWGSAEVPVLVLTALGLFAVNQFLFRFADDQSILILYASAMAATVMNLEWNGYALTALVLAVNPLPAVFGGKAWQRTGSLVRMENYPPFDQSRIEEAMRVFLMVARGQRVLFAFDNPQDEYERVFDGYRVLLELPLFVAADKGVHLMPDWYAIAETNYAGSPDFWGRSPQAVLTNAQRWGATHVIVYQDTGTALDPAWLRDFEPVSEFDWGDWTDELRGVELWSTEKPPKWWLLKVVAPRDGNA